MGLIALMGFQMVKRYFEERARGEGDHPRTPEDLIARMAEGARLDAEEVEQASRTAFKLTSAMDSHPNAEVLSHGSAKTSEESGHHPPAPGPNIF